jgi:hypothetical protein
MASIKLQGDTSGELTISAPAVAGTHTLILPASSGTLATAASAGFPSGTKQLFVQTAAPTGWTKDTTHDNKSLRVVSGTAGSGGSVDFTTAFASQTPTGSVTITSVTGSAGATTLSTSQIPSHTHTYERTPYISYGGTSGFGSHADNVLQSVATGATGGGGSHDHAFSFSSGSGTFSGTAIDLAVQYVDTIIATKD